MNLKPIADGIAAQFLGVTATVGTRTESLSMCTSSLPNVIGAGPALLVYHPIGVLDVAMSKIRRDEYDFPVRLMRDPVNYPDRSDWLYAWFDSTRDRVEMNMDLGLTYVAWARPVESRVALDGQSYAGIKFDVVEYIVRVHINEIATSMAV